MGDGYDRFDNEGGGGGSFVMGLLTGTVLGAGLGMLFAPKSGSELRGQISEQAGNIANQAQEGYRRASLARGEAVGGLLDTIVEEPIGIFRTKDQPCSHRFPKLTVHLLLGALVNHSQHGELRAVAKAGKLL